MEAAKVILIVGPTAGGKSALAMRVAAETGGEIVGADSMQLYADLRVLTARPSEQDEAAVPHHLTGNVDAGEAWSVGRWQRAATAALQDIAGRGATAVVVGGTGLYFSALTKGLADIPPVDRTHSTALWDEGGEPAVREALKSLDPDAEARIEAGDRQRLIRAHAVAIGTGRPLSAWQAETHPVLAPGAYRALVVEPPREALYARCDKRLEMMVEAGALDEVRALLARGLDPALPAMKVLGFRELAAHVRGETSLKTALAAAQQATRHYAKRQLTWFRNQTPDWERTNPH